MNPESGSSKLSRRDLIKVGLAAGAGMSAIFGRSEEARAGAPSPDAPYNSNYLGDPISIKMQEGWENPVEGMTLDGQKTLTIKGETYPDGVQTTLQLTLRPLQEGETRDTIKDSFVKAIQLKQQEVANGNYLAPVVNDFGLGKNLGYTIIASLPCPESSTNTETYVNNFVPLASNNKLFDAVLTTTGDFAAAQKEYAKCVAALDSASVGNSTK